MLGHMQKVSHFWAQIRALFTIDTCSIFVSPADYKKSWILDVLNAYWVVVVKLLNSSVVLMVVQGGERNRYDQRWVQHLMAEV